MSSGAPDAARRATRSHTIAEPTAHTGTLLLAARGLLGVAAPLIAEDGLTLIGVALSNLASGDAIQLALPFDQHQTPALDVALDAVRDRFGTSAVSRAALLRHGACDTVPLLPD